MVTTLGDIRRSTVKTSKLRPEQRSAPTATAATAATAATNTTSAAKDFKHEWLSYFDPDNAELLSPSEASSESEPAPLGEASLTKEELAALIARGLRYDEERIVDMFNETIKQATRRATTPGGAWQERQSQERESRGWTVAGHTMPETDEEVQSAIFSGIAQERRRQNGLHGGAVIDDRHDYLEWQGLIMRQLSLANNDWRKYNIAEVRRRFTNIGALAVAAIEAINRNGRDALN